MDPAQLSDSATLLLSATGVLTPVSQVLTIPVEKDTEEGGLPPNVEEETQIEVAVGEPEQKLPEDSVSGLPVQDPLTSMLDEKSLTPETFETKPDEKAITGFAESQTTLAAENLQFVIVRVKASELIGTIRKLVADSIHVPLETCFMFHHEIEVSKIISSFK